jgi:Na+/H+-dicarboxylate symporter
MKWLLSLSSFKRVMLGLGLGIFAGLFFGELAGKLEIFGEAYIRLLQMTVLPYIIVSLISGLGRLNADIAKRIGIAGAC